MRAGALQATSDCSIAATAIGLLALACSSARPGVDAGATDVAPVDATGFAWREGAPCPVARFEAGAAVVGGELWVMGGFVSSDLEVTARTSIYDPAGDVWRDGPELPGAETHFGAVTDGDDLLVIGGLKTKELTATAEVWRWRAAEARWVAGPPLPAAQAAFAWALIGDEVHVAGGLGPDGKSDAAAHLAWNLGGGASWTPAAPLPDPRNHGGGAASGGRFFAIAGRHGWNEISGDDAAVHAFDPASGAWTARAPIPNPRSEIGAATTAMPDGRILVVGGSTSGIQPSPDALVYDPASDVWLALPPLPAPRKGAVAQRLGSAVVVTTGSPTSVDPSATTWVGCCL